LSNRYERRRGSGDGPNFGFKFRIQTNNFYSLKTSDQKTKHICKFIIYWRLVWFKKNNNILEYGCGNLTPPCPRVKGNFRFSSYIYPKLSYEEPILFED